MTGLPTELGMPHHQLVPTNQSHQSYLIHLISWRSIMAKHFISHHDRFQSIPPSTLRTYSTSHSNSMFIARRNVRKPLSWPLRSVQIRYATNKITNSQLEASNEISERLKDTGNWVWGRGRTPKKSSASGDKNRANITSEKLCGMFLFA